MKISKLLGLTILLGAQIAEAEQVTLADLTNQVFASSMASALANSAISSYSNGAEGLSNPIVNGSVYSKSETAYLSGTTYDAGSNTYRSYSAKAKAYADITTGKVGAYAIGAPSSAALVSAVAEASFFEYLQFNIAGATNDTVTKIPFSLNVDGSFGTAPGSYGYGQALLSLGFNDTGFSCYPSCSNPLNAFSYAEIMGYDPDLGEMYDRDLVNGGPFYTSDGNFDINGELYVYGTGSIWSMSLSMVALYNADFYHTASFSFDLPDNVTFESASGKFLTESNPPSGVPVPAAAWLFGSALLGFVGIKRRKA